MKPFLPFWISLFLYCSCQNISDKKEYEGQAEIFSTKIISSIAFGSCADQNKPQPALEVALSKKPELFIYLGDNIYADTRNMDTLRYKYQLLESKPEFQKLRAATMVLAIWDDHDFGENDAGRHYPFKKESKEIFLDFWKVPQNAARRQREGIYEALLFGPPEKRLQVILLDTRTFRDDLLLNDDSTRWKNDYRPNPNPDSTFLGREQWHWLETQFQVAAKVRIIASSNQFSHEYNGWESWTNVPKERQRMLDLIKKTQANGIIFLSGDVHWGELSKLEVAGLYPIYDITSSGITQTWDVLEPSKNRLGEAVMENNIGLLEIDWQQADPLIKMQLFDVTDSLRVAHQIHLSEISF